MSADSLRPRIFGASRMSSDQVSPEISASVSMNVMKKRLTRERHETVELHYSRIPAGFQHARRFCRTECDSRILRIFQFFCLQLERGLCRLCLEMWVLRPICSFKMHCMWVSDPLR